MSVRILVGDVREKLAEIPDASVQTCVTSPPYWGLRDYCVEGQIGIERTPDEYVESLVRVLREVRRVLRDDGTLWLNLGDSYASGTRGAGGSGKQHTNAGSVLSDRSWKIPPGIKPKDLVGIPWRVAFALQTAGWYLRSDIIWAKPNAMPESVTDRPTKSHEYIFLLSKSARYFYDAKAVREESAAEWNAKSFGGANEKGAGDPLLRTRGADSFHADIARSGRNIRSVWTIATSPFRGAHFATFPPALPERCIKAGTSEHGACAGCGSPWWRATERGDPPTVPPSSLDRYGTGDSGVHRAIGGQYQKWLDAHPRKTTGFCPSCKCDAPVRPCVVLDPFAGAGTTGLVADRLGRDAVLIELNPKYAEMAERRIRGDAPLLTNPELKEGTHP